MNDGTDQTDPLERLADEFASACRRGENPSIPDYVARYPRYAAQIEELFPAVALMEQFRAAEHEQRRSAAAAVAACDPPEHVGDFRLLRRIGRGGMGVVYEAEQQSLARPVALKVLPKHVLLLDRHVERFRREAQTAARLHHSNIVPVFGVGQQGELHYYVMPLVRGVGLDEIIRELAGQSRPSATGPAARDGCSRPDHDLVTVVRLLTARKFAAAETPALGPEQDGSSGRRAREDRPCAPRMRHWRTVARIGLQAAAALDYAHAQGTLHCDVKPGNLLVDGDGVVYVADFGLARAVDHDGHGGDREFGGTVRYMAPEQLRGAADARSDVYALGLTLYELLALRPAVDLRHLESGPDARRPVVAPLAGIDPAIPRDLDAIVMKCLAHEPSGRYPSAAALAADLQRFLEDRPVAARRLSSAHRVGRWCRRNPALAAMSGLTAAMLVIVVATALVGHLRTRGAYAETQRSLQRAEATSRLALDALDSIYRQLSPERLWIASDTDPGGQVCACIGPGLGDGPGAPAKPAAMRVQASGQTASLLENLLVFYDHLAEQGGHDSRVLLQSAVANRRVGDIRLCLGQADQAEREYSRAVEKLDALLARPGAGADVRTELARTLNEIGNVQSSRLEQGRAYASHQKALSVLKACDATIVPPAESRYELARTMYFLSSKRPIAPDRRPAQWRAGSSAELWGLRARANEYRKSATRILEGLVEERPRAPDCQLLLALCYRLPSSAPARRASDVQDRQAAIWLLEELTAEYPAVADYRYELVNAYAWTPVGLFPWQGRSAAAVEGHQHLRQALHESQRLVDQHPGVPHYARSQVIILAKLAACCSAQGRAAEAEDLFRRALETQTALVAQFPRLPPQNLVLREFLRLRLAQLGCRGNVGSRSGSVASQSRASLDACIDNLTELTRRPELAGDRLAWNALMAAYDTLSQLLSHSGEKDKAEQARTKADTIRTNRLSGLALGVLE